MSNDAPDPFKEVMTRESLAAMIHSLCDDFRRRGEEWENRTVEDYLGALAAWIMDSPGSYRNSVKSCRRTEIGRSLPGP